MVFTGRRSKADGTLFHNLKTIIAVLFEKIHTTMAGISIEMPAIVLVVYKEAIILHCLRGKD